MAEVDFHSGLADKLAYACRLLRKVRRGGLPAVVTGPAPDLARLDQLLWTFDPGEFLPHARLRAGEAAAPRLARTPIWLAERPEDAPAAAGAVLVNLGPDALSLDARFQRVVELVARDDADVTAGRQRWRQYKAAGIEPRNHRPEPTPEAPVR